MTSPIEDAACALLERLQQESAIPIDDFGSPIRFEVAQLRRALKQEQVEQKLAQADEASRALLSWHDGGGAHWLVNEDGKVVSRVVPYVAQAGDGTTIFVVTELMDNESDSQVGLFWGLDAAKRAAEEKLL